MSDAAKALFIADNPGPTPDQGNFEGDFGVIWAGWDYWEAVAEIEAKAKA